jgi:hypothetical protein
MHDWDGLASDALVGIFRIAEEGAAAPGSSLPQRERAQGLSNGARAKRSHCACFE